MVTFWLKKAHFRHVFAHFFLTYLTQTLQTRQIELLRSRLNDFTVDFENAANLTFDISQIASEQNVTGFSIGSKESCENVVPPNCRHIYENHITVSFVGSFNQFAALLSALERHRPVIFIDKFTVTCSGQNDSAHQINMDLVVFVAKLRSG